MSSRRLSRRQLLRTGGAVATAFAGCLATETDDPDPVGFADGFEAGFSGWEVDADVPADPNEPGQPVAWTVARSTERAASGSASLRFSLDGRQDDGTIWAVRPLAVESGRAYDVTVRAEAWSPTESFNTLAHLVMYAGAARPTAEGSFPAPGETSSGAGVVATGGLREALNRAEGWTRYSFDWATPPLERDTIYVAVGISAVWETELTYFVDDVEGTATAR